MGYYSFNRPRRDGRLSWPCWLTDSGRLTHKVVTRPAISLAQDRERSPAVTGVLTTMLRHQLMPISCHFHCEVLLSMCSSWSSAISSTGPLPFTTRYTVTAGMRARSRDVLVHPQHGGRRCPEPLTQNMYCAYRECYQWQASDWGPCQTEVSWLTY